MGEEFYHGQICEEKQEKKFFSAIFREETRISNEFFPEKFSDGKRKFFQK